MSYLDPHHIERIQKAYLSFEEEENFSALVDIDQILEDKNARLSVQLYVKKKTEDQEPFETILSNWESASEELKDSMEDLFKSLADG